MTDPLDPRSNYSAEVRLRLIVGDRSFPLAKIGPSHVVLREPTELAPGAAEVVMTVDGREHRWAVYLTGDAIVSGSAKQICLKESGRRDG